MQTNFVFQWSHKFLERGPSSGKRIFGRYHTKPFEGQGAAPERIFWRTFEEVYFQQWTLSWIYSVVALSWTFSIINPMFLFPEHMDKFYWTATLVIYLSFTKTCCANCVKVGLKAMRYFLPDDLQICRNKMQ